jgi:hypothetical protein
MQPIHRKPHSRVLKAFHTKIEPTFGIAFFFAGAVTRCPDVKVWYACVRVEVEGV